MYCTNIKLISQIQSASLAFWGDIFGSNSEVLSLQHLLLFLPQLSKVGTCPCCSVPHHVHCHVARDVKDLFLLPSPSGNTSDFGSPGAAKTLDS